MTTLELDDEQSLLPTVPDAYDRLLARLSQQSVTKHFDAYADVPWDDPQMAIDPTDPRWELTSADALAHHPWYQAQPQHIRSGIGLMWIASNMKTGLEFESVLKRGLLEFAATLPNGAPEFQYAYHEVVEEAHHSMMFQEFVNRTGFDVEGMPPVVAIGARQVVRLGRAFPTLFFMFVLGGEDPIDYVQREALRSEDPVHPLLERIMRIHVTEEARHLSFARHYLKRHVPELSRTKHHALAIQTPLILGGMAAQMLMPPRQVVTTYGIPADVVRDAFRENPANQQFVKDSLRKVRALAVELGLITPAAKRLWQAFGLWDEDQTLSA